MVIGLAVDGLLALTEATKASMYWNWAFVLPLQYDVLPAMEHGSCNQWSAYGLWKRVCFEGSVTLLSVSFVHVCVKELVVCGDLREASRYFREHFRGLAFCLASGLQAQDIHSHCSP
jgi:hypothetical protein